MRMSLDRPLLLITLFLVTIGAITFLSASLGLLGKDSTVSLSRLYGTQIGLGLIGGIIALFIVSLLSKKFLKSLAPFAYVGSILLTLLVFVPSLSISTKGASRWLDLGFVSFQPSELLKIGCLLLFAFVMSTFSWKGSAWWEGPLRLLGVLFIPCILLLLQPDNDNFIILITSVVTMYIVSGAPWKHIIIMGVGGIIALGILVAVHPYILNRVETFLNPSRDPSGSSYQIRQSLIAVGSGEIFGRGVGQSVQKFSYLPEPVGDSIFAVYAEEVGFVGSTVLIGFFMLFFGRGMWLASRVRDKFSALTIVGISSVIVYQAFLNIGAMVGVVPLTGLTLPFVSHGGTSLLVTLIMVGIMLSVSRGAAHSTHTQKS